jgi:tRNA G10  N-methylase Trm11
MPEYLCYFAQIHENFRLPELHALSDLFAADLTYNVEEYADTVGPIFNETSLLLYNNANFSMEHVFVWKESLLEDPIEIT